MSSPVYIRLLKPTDGLVSYAWRNNPRLWRFTGSRPDRYITPEMEMRWIEEVSKRSDEKRFAICLSEDDKYIGNIFLTRIQNGEALIHIFIGDMRYWGGGRGRAAAKLLSTLAFTEFGLKSLNAWVDHRNLVCISQTKLCGFSVVREFYSAEHNTKMVHLEYTAETFFAEQAKEIRTKIQDPSNAHKRRA